MNRRHTRDETQLSPVFIVAYKPYLASVHIWNHIDNLAFRSLATCSSKQH